jgi:hypothetical protein
MNLNMRRFVGPLNLQTSSHLLFGFLALRLPLVKNYLGGIFDGIICRR